MEDVIVCLTAFFSFFFYLFVVSEKSALGSIKIGSIQFMLVMP